MLVVSQEHLLQAGVYAAVREIVVGDRVSTREGVVLSRVNVQLQVSLDDPRVRALLLAD